MNDLDIRLLDICFRITYIDDFILLTRIHTHIRSNKTISFDFLVILTKSLVLIKHSVIMFSDHLYGYVSVEYF